MTDDRISRHLHEQAEGIALPPADPAGAMRRGARRRTRRRAALLGSVAVVGLVATSVAVRSGDDSDQRVDFATSPNAAASSFHWSVVTPQSGLAYGSDTAQLADGSIYSISTAPGPYREDKPAESVLYRSTDGAEWSAATLPSGMRTNALAGAGDTLYSVGTSPAGGLLLASSRDGAASWSSRALPDDVAQLVARHPGKITLGATRVAVGSDGHVVATELVSTSTDLPAYLPQYRGSEDYWQWGPDGVTVFENPKSSCEGLADAPAATTVDDAKQCRAADVDAQRRGEAGTPIASYTYDELGITGELRDHLGGRIYAYESDDGETFRRVDVPQPAPDASSSTYAATPVAVDGGFALVATRSTSTADGKGGSATTILSSSDGTTWTEAGSFAGSAGSVGTVGGRLAMSVWDDDGGSSVQLRQADGTWAPLDVAGAVPTPAGTVASVDDVAFGPLGLAAVVGVSEKEGRSYVQYLVHTDGTGSLQVEPVRDLATGGGLVSGVVVTPDAIVARVTSPNDGDSSTPPTQQVLVGTPG